jgi:hypothetical protein
MTRLPSKMAVICASLRVSPSMAREPWIVRMRLARRRRRARPAWLPAARYPRVSMMSARTAGRQRGLVGFHCGRPAGKRSRVGRARRGVHVMKLRTFMV